MNAKDIVNQLKNHKGQHVPAIWQREMKTRKRNDLQVVVTKRTTAFVRAGIDYANLSVVKEGIANGERGEIEPLKWGEWVEFPFTISHKGSDYIRLYPATFANLQGRTVEYFIDGKPATRAEVEPLCLASEFSDNEEKPLCFTLKAENIISIG